MPSEPLRITRTARFKKHYRTRIRSHRLKASVVDAIQRFLEEPDAPELRNHILTGSMHGLCSFSVTDGVRIIYLPTNKGVVFLDIGSHQQVYRM